MNVFDASALLAYLRGEAGSEVVRPELERGGAARRADSDRHLSAAARQGIPRLHLPDAEDAAAMWQRGSGLSLADRLCLALAERLGATAWTADAQWGDHPRASQIR